MTIRAYDELYLGSAQNVLGHAADFAIVTLGVEPDLFGACLAVCGSARQFANGNPAYVAGVTGCELARAMLDEAHVAYPEKEDVMYLDKSPEYWAGWALAYYQWYSSTPFYVILDAAPLEEIMGMYPLYHEMDVERFAERMDDLMRAAHPHTRLREQRDACGLSQAELASQAEVPIRQIQLFEQRQRSINRASAITLLKLSRALHCGMEDLIEQETETRA